MERNSFMDATSPTDERFETLKQLYPELIRDNKLNLEALKDLFDEESFDEGDVGYNLYWPGKRDAKKLARKEAEGTLEPVIGDGVNEDKTSNIYIEGDNLEVLRCLKKSYGGRVKMIYIDPPYNTGKDFIYPDNFAEPVEDYLKFTRQVDEQGVSLVANPKSSGAYHRKWLDMMLPRLQLARELLTNDGVIFISIDDNEQANLKLLCDEVFGEENFVNEFIWINKPEGRQISGAGAAGAHEYVLLYAKNINYQNIYGLSAEWLKKLMPSSYKGFNFNVKRDEIGPYIATHELFNGNSKFNEETRPSLVFDIYYRESDCDIIIEDVSNQHLHQGYAKIKPHSNSDGVHMYHAYRWSKRKILTEKENLEFVKYGNTFKIFSKRRNFDITTIRDIITDINTTIGNAELKNLGIGGFDYPKSTSLISLFVNMMTCKSEEETDDANENDGAFASPIILDFFSGSSTTAHSVLRMSAEDNVQRKFIMVQLPVALNEDESNDKKAIEFLDSIHKPHTICEIGKERIRRAGKMILEEHPELKDKLDVGFKVYRLAKSNISSYKPTTGSDQQSLLSALDAMEKQVTPLRDGFDLKNSNDIQKLLTEIMLRQGFALDSHVEKTSSLAKNSVYRITDEARPIVLHVCLDSEIKPETVKSICFEENDKFVCLNSAISDELYAQLSDKGRVETI